MALELHVVHLDDDADDRALVADTLLVEGIACTITPAWSRETFEDALRRSPDLLLVDFSVPGFGGMDAQELAQQRCPDVPLIFVSGSIGEEGAVERLRAGATDYVLKHRLDKLAPAVARAITEAANRRARERADQELRRLNAELEDRVAERTRSLEQAMRDVEQARAAADAANTAKSEFLSRMSHDLRTPLNAVLGFAQLLEQEASSETQQAYVRQIMTGGRHLLALIEEVLDLSRIEAGRLALSLENVDVRDALNGVMALIEPLAAQRGVTLATVSGTHPWCVRADPRRLNQVLMNLLSNAVKYNREQGTVRIAVTAPRDRTVRIAVEDTGRGLTPDQMARLFTPFERLGAEATDVEGTGLGLAVVKGLIGAMAGQVGVESVAGIGSTFWVELPEDEPRAAADAERAASDAADAGAPPRPHDAVTVLYIEDNPANTFLVESALRRRPTVQLKTAATGADGIEQALTAAPDVILLDLNLPDMSGANVLTRLRAEAAVADVPIVVLSADATPASQQRLLAIGATAYLTKPLNIKRLLTLIDELSAA
jgi:signal transduction histidine kinase